MPARQQTMTPQTRRAIIKRIALWTLNQQDVLMPRSGLWLLPHLSLRQTVSRALPLLMLLLLTACSSGYQGRECSGEIQTLSGQPRGTTQGMIVDRFSSFSVTLPDMQLDSGPLYSSDRRTYIPSATTQNGWLAQRLSDRRFTIVNAPRDEAITFTCPVP